MKDLKKIKHFWRVPLHCKGALCFIFSICILLSSSVPYFAFADDVTPTFILNHYKYKNSNGDLVDVEVPANAVSNENGNTFTFSRNDATTSSYYKDTSSYPPPWVTNGDFKQFTLDSQIVRKFDKNDNVDLVFAIYPNSRYTWLRAVVSITDEFGNRLYYVNSEELDFDRVKGTITIPTFKVTSTTRCLFCDITVYEFGVNKDYNNIYLKFNGLYSCEVEDGDTGLLNSIIEWLRDIKDKLVNGFADLKDSFISKLQSFSDSVGTWFTNLFNNLRDFFANVGEWFSSLGDRISEFFVNIWNNFTNWWDSLWTLPDGWAESYKNQWDSWLLEHFGALYQSENLVVDYFNNFKDILDSEGNSVITIPEVTLPMPRPDSNITVIPQQNFDFDSIWGDSRFIVIRIICQTFMSMIVIFLTIVFCKRQFDKIIQGGADK